ncbi:MAG: hypothetical protein ACREDY_05865 [Bradyrhizobium sp.]
MSSATLIAFVLCTCLFAPLGAQSVPDIRFAAGYSRAFGGGGYGFTVDAIVLSPPVGSRASLDVGLSGWYDRTSIPGTSDIERAMVGIGPTVTLRMPIATSGIEVFAGAMAQYLHSANGSIIRAGSPGSTPPLENGNAATASALAIGGDIGLMKAITQHFGLILGATALHQALFSGADHWIYRLQAGVSVGVR